MEGQSYYIGDAAGKIYKALEGRGQTDLLKLQKDAGIFEEALFNQAIGWLAREGKLNFNKSGKTYRLSLATANV